MIWTDVVKKIAVVNTKKRKIKLSYIVRCFYLYMVKKRSKITKKKQRTISSQSFGGGSVPTS